MLWSQTFIPTLKETPSEAEVVSHRLMLRAGLIRKVSSGLYTYLPTGLTVIRKVENIIREEVQRRGAIELLMPILQPKGLWVESGRWGEQELSMLTVKTREDKEFALAPTHEEVVTDLIRGQLNSYRQLPMNFFQIQTKFRDELRPRFGLMRAKEFVMKDGYSFDASEDEARVTYKKMEEAYRSIFSRCGLDVVMVEADSGAMGGGFSHEFMAPADAGEDTVATCPACGYCANREVVEAEFCPGCGGNLQTGRGIEVGQLFFLGTKYSRALKAAFLNKNGKEELPVMGCYGIGVTRVVSAVIEQNHDSSGIIWPAEVAPFESLILPLNVSDKTIMEIAHRVYDRLSEEGCEVLLDDRDVQAGVKFKDADLIGIPTQVIIGEKGSKTGKVEIKNRRSGKIRKVGISELSRALLPFHEP